MIYLLETSKGSWDDYAHIVIGVTTCPFEAEKLKQEWLVKLKEKQLQYSNQEILNLDYEYENFNGNESEVPEYLNNYLDWLFKEYLEYSNQVKITELKENTIIWNNLQD